MKAGKDQGFLSIHEIQQAVGKPVDHCLPNLTVNPRETRWEAKDRGRREVDSSHKFGSETWNALLVPCAGLENVETSLGTEAERHLAQGR
jgi:hypothetical protein